MVAPERLFREVQVREAVGETWRGMVTRVGDGQRGLAVGRVCPKSTNPRIPRIPRIPQMGDMQLVTAALLSSHDTFRSAAWRLSKRADDNTQTIFQCQATNLFDLPNRIDHFQFKCT